MPVENGCAHEEPDNRPRSLRYAEHARTIEQMIMDALPRVVTKLVSMAEEGNIAAAKYLIDRIHGLPAKLTTAAVADTSLTYTHHEWATDLLQQKAQRDDVSRRAMLTISRCAPPPGKRR